MDVYRIYSTILMYDHRVNVILCPVKRGHTARDKCSRSSMFFFSSKGNFGLYFHSSIEIYIFDAEKIKPFPNEPWVRIHQLFSRTFFVFFSKICNFECNTTSDWLNRTV